MYEYPMCFLNELFSLKISKYIKIIFKQSVVSGTVEPDTFIVNRTDAAFKITEQILGSKTRHVTASGDGTVTCDVPEPERNRACLTEAEVKALAEVSVRQEVLWGAARDIEWAYCKVNCFVCYC